MRQVEINAINSRLISFEFVSAQLLIVVNCLLADLDALLKVAKGIVKVRQPDIRIVVVPAVLNGFLEVRFRFLKIHHLKVNNADVIVQDAQPRLDIV